MQLVLIAAHFSDLPHCHIGIFQIFRSLCHPIINKKMLKRLIGVLLKQLSKIVPVQAAVIGDILHRNIVAVILFNKRNRFPHIGVPQFSGGLGAFRDRPPPLISPSKKRYK